METPLQACEFNQNPACSPFKIAQEVFRPKKLQFDPKTHFQSIMRSGFSLMETLIVLALFALAGGLVVTNFDTLIDSYSNKSSESVLWEALAAARSEAIALQKSTQLSFDYDKQVFKIEDLERNLIKEYTLKDQSTLKLTFHARLPAKSLDEARHPKPSDEKIPYILFTSQGYSPPVILTVEKNNNFKRLILDPFSNGEVFEENSPSES